MGLKQPGELFRQAAARRYCLGAFNTFSLESLLAVLEAAQAQRSPVILQVSMGARGYVRHFESYVETMRRMAVHYDIPCFIQHDHCGSFEACREAVEAGCQAVMYDGSHLSYEENARETRRVADYAHRHGVWVEAELGSLPGFEDLVFAEKAVFTDPALVGRFIDETGCDALAVAVGTSHGGVRGEDYLPLDLALLEEIVSRRPGYPFVLHGAASLPPALIDACNRQGGRVEYLRNCSEESIAAAVKAGVRKVNMDVDNFLVFTTEVRRFLREQPAVYDPRKYLKPAMAAFQREVEHKISAVLGSAGMAREEEA